MIALISAVSSAFADGGKVSAKTSANKATANLII
jgi:hypothetical protein